MEHLKSLSGPEFLDHLAAAEAANCNDINAEVYRANATQWAAETSRQQFPNDTKRYRYYLAEAERLDPSSGRSAP